MSVRLAVLAVLGLSAAASLNARDAKANEAALADEAQPAEDALGTVVVTAQRRAENVEKVPISVAAVSGDALASTGINNTQELANSVPGLNISNNVGNSTVFIRGIGTTALSVENDVGIYVDGVYITSQTASLLNLSNIDHVEILKGPQGTLFGRNAVGGALQIVTKDPSHQPTADISVGYANYDTVTANAYGATGITDNLATDVAFYYSNQGNGWGHNLTTDQPTFRARQIQVRNKWVLTPTETTKISLSLDYANNRNELGAGWQFFPGRFGVDGKSTYAGFYNTWGDGLSQNSSQQHGETLRIDQDLGWARAVSITADRGSTNRNFIDQDATPLPVVEGGPTPQNDQSFSQELQLLSPDNASKVKWIFGAYYLHDKYYTPGFNIQVGTTTHETLFVEEPTNSYATFGQATVEILPDTHFTAGLRYTDDEKSVTGVTFLNGTQLPPIPGTTDPSHQKASFNKLTYRAVLDHQITPELFGYVSYDTGFKSGQFNLISYAAPAIQPEDLTAWQAGLKSELLDHHLRLNVAGFLYNYTNIQITQTKTGTVELLNAAAAKIYGLDVDFDALIVSDLRVQGALDVLHGYYTNFPDAPSYIPAVDPVTGLPRGGNVLSTIANARGKDTVHSPRATAYLAGDYSFALPQGRVELNANLSYSDGYFWDPDNRLEQPSYILLGAFAKWLPTNGKWDVRVWGNNLTDRRYYSYESAFSLGDIGSGAPPRTYGITGTVHF